MVTNGSLRVRSNDQSVSTKWVAGCKLTPCRNHSVRDVLCVRQARMQRKICVTTMVRVDSPRSIGEFPLCLI